jgi:hypothetical protein
VMRGFAVFLVVLAPSLAFGQAPQVNVTDITYILEDEVPGLGIKVDISEWVAADDMSELAQEICEQIAPKVLPEIEKQEGLEAPEFIEIDAKVPRSYGIINLNVGQVRRFSNRNGTCAPLWEE